MPDCSNNVIIHAQLTGSDQCSAEGFSVCHTAPVLAMCRTLIDAGYDPERPLHAYRGEVLSLRVRSIGEAARLQYQDGGGFSRKKFSNPGKNSSKGNGPVAGGGSDAPPSV